MSRMAGKNHKGVIFALASMAVVVLAMLIAHQRSPIIAQLAAPEGGIKKLFTSGDLLAAVSKSCEVYVWDWRELSAKPRKGRFKAEDLTVTKGGVVILVPVSQTDRLVACNLEGDKTEKVIRLGDGWRCKVVRTSHNGKFTAAGLVNEASGGAVGLGIVEPDSGRVSIVAIPTSGGAKPTLVNIAVSEDGTLVAAVGARNGGWIAVSQVDSNKLLWERDVNGVGRLNEVCFSADGRTIYVGGNSLFIYGLATVTGDELYKWTIPVDIKDPSYGQQKGVSAIEASGDNKFVLVAGTYTRIFKLDSKLSRQLDVISHGGWTIVDFAFSPDSSRFSGGDLRAQEKVKIWPTGRTN